MSSENNVGSVALARRLAKMSLGQVPDDPEVLAKLKTCLFDLIGCCFESRHLPWAQQAAAVAARTAGPATIIGGPGGVAVSEAAFAGSVAGHGLVREDMHAGSVSHLGIVILPSLLAIAQRQPIDGKSFVAACVVGYEVGGRLGRALVTSDFARFFRPTGFVGPIAVAAAISRLLNADETVTTAAMAMAANTTSGLNEWPHTGADEMFFEPGFASRNAIMAFDLAELGARASERSLDGEAGLFSAYRPGFDTSGVALFPGGAVELLDVYNKAVPVCNFAQTPCLAALAIKRGDDIRAADIKKITVRVTRAAQRYPGCDWAGPFGRILQAKMSIQYAVAAALLHGAVTEECYERLGDPELLRLAGMVQLVEDDALTAAFPAKQGAAVTVELVDGTERTQKLDSVIAATDREIRDRFRATVTSAIGVDAARRIEEFIDTIENADDVGQLAAMTMY